MEVSVAIHQIWISPAHDFKGRYGKTRLTNGTLPVEEIECRAGRGLVGDRYFDHKPDFKGQVTLFDFEVLKALQDALSLASVDGSALRRNVLISGIDLNALIGRRFTVGDVELSGSEECAPCFWMDEAIAPGAHEWLKGRGGLRCRIHSDGFIRCGANQLIVCR